MKRTGLIFVGLLIFSIVFLMIYTYAYQISRPVPFEDGNLELLIRKTLEKQEDDILVSHLRNITTLDATGYEIKSLEGMQFMKNLKVLILEDNRITDVRPLQELNNLEELNLRNNAITSLNAIHFDTLKDLPELRKLSLRHNVKRPDPEDQSYQQRIEDIEILGEFSLLEELDLRDNHIQDPAPLENLTNLKKLDISQNPIKNGNLSVLSSLTALEELNVRETGAKELTFLDGMDRLTYLNIHSNKSIADLNPIQNLVYLQTLIMANVSVGGDLNFLSPLTQLTRLNIRNTGTEDLKVIGNLMGDGTLQDVPELGVKVVIDIRENPIPLERRGEVGGYAPVREFWENVAHAKPSELHNPIDNELYINEIMASNGETIAAADGNYYDWIELYNPNDHEVNLKGYYLSDDDENLSRWEFPQKTIDEGEFLIVWASGKDKVDEEGMLHTNFSINRQGEPIILSEPDGQTVVDYVPMKKIPRDVSFGRVRDEEDKMKLLQIPTPSKENSAAEFVDVPDLPEFSHQGGFYKEAFELTLTGNENERIYYTLDGSVPSEEGLLYDWSIELREGVSLRDEEFPRATVVKAIAYNREGDQSGVRTYSYFVGEEVFDRFSFPVISISTDEENLFDEEIGIYAEGNYHQGGRAWERPINFEIYEPNGVPGLNQNLGLRIHGGYTRSYDQKSLRLYARSIYDEKDTMEYDFFPDLEAYGGNHKIDEFQRLILRNSGNDWNRTMFRDAFMQGLVKDIGTFSLQASRPSVVFINGEYWGIHNIRERQDEYFLNAHYGVDPENVIILESRSGSFDKGNPEGMNHYHEMIAFIDTNSLKSPENYQQLKTMMDTNSFADYLIAQIYFGNIDWPHNNIRFWRYITDEYNPGADFGKDGRWRWLLFDVDYGFSMFRGNEDRHGEQGDYTHDTLQWVLTKEGGRLENETNSNFLIRNLLGNEDFKEDFIRRFTDYLNIYFSEDKVLKDINAYQNNYKREIGWQLNRWKLHQGEVNRWNNEVDVLRDFAEKRPDYIRQYLTKHFGLKDTFTLEIHHENLEQGTILVNGLDIFQYNDAGDNNPWEGVYFSDYPIEVSVVPEDGYEFLGWEEENEKQNPLILNKNTSITPIFETIGRVYYDDYHEDIEKAKMMNRALIYTLAIVLSALITWSTLYFSKEKYRKYDKKISIGVLIIATLLVYPVLVNLMDQGAVHIISDLSIRVLFFCVAVGIIIGSFLPKKTKMIKVFDG